MVKNKSDLTNFYKDSGSVCAFAREDLITVYDLVSVNLIRDCLMHAKCRSNESNTLNIRLILFPEISIDTRIHLLHLC